MKRYLLIGGGDGHSTRVVTEAELEEAFIGMHYMPASDCPADERAGYLEVLRDEDSWEQRPRRLHRQYEDGYVEVIELDDDAIPPTRVVCVLQGGNLTDVIADRPVHAYLCDYDVEVYDEDLVDVPQGSSGETAKAVFGQVPAEHNQATVDGFLALEKKG